MNCCRPGTSEPTPALALPRTGSIDSPIGAQPPRRPQPRRDNPTALREALRSAHRGGPGSVGCSVADRKVAMERDDAELRAANERITMMAEELRKAVLVRDRLEGLAQLMGSYPEGHEMRARLEALHVDQTLEGVNEDIRLLTDA